MQILTDAEHRDAMERVDALMAAEIEAPEVKELNELIDAIEVYEDKFFLKTLNPQTPEHMNCPCCKNSDVHKVMSFGIPGRMCMSCNAVWGLVAYAPAIPVETPDGPQFAFLHYEGSYWVALWYWLTGKAF